VVNAVHVTIRARCRILVHLSLLCRLAHARPKTPSEQTYSEPLINTSFIMVMVFLLSRTITILNIMRGIVLRAFSGSTGRAVQLLFNYLVSTRWNSWSAPCHLWDQV